MAKLPSVCPSCDHPLLVSELDCPNCETIISGRYPLPALLLLPADDQDFVLQFIMSGGSLKKMSSKLKQSYPTVRNRLDDIIAKLSNHQKQNS